MNKIETLDHVKVLLAQGELTKQELLRVIETIDQGTVQMPGVAGRRFSLTQVLYYIGAGIVVMGIAVLVGQNWHALNSTTRIVASLGVAVASYVTAVLFSSKEKTIQVAQAFYFISGVLLPVGLAVTFYEAGYSLDSLAIETTIIGISLCVWLASFILLRNTVALIFSILFGLFFFFISTSYITAGLPAFAGNHFTEYRFLVAGVSLMLLGYGLAVGTFKKLTGALYSVGVIGFLSAAISLGGFKPAQNLVWEIIFPGLVFAIILLSIYVKSKSLLTFGALFLMGFIIKITAEYFTDSLGWPLALVLVGLTLIGIGYLTVSVNKRYLLRPTSINLPNS